MRLVFLLRRNAARQLVSRLLNAEDKAMFKTSALKSEIAAARQKKK